MNIACEVAMLKIEIDVVICLVYNTASDLITFYFDKESVSTPGHVFGWSFM